MKKMLLLHIALFTFIASSMIAEEQPIPIVASIAPEETVSTSHSMKIDDELLEYTATAGTLRIAGQADKDTANLFYVYYKKKTQDPNRPLAICFNGGPGSSSIWLHIGLLGPKRVHTQDFKYNRSPGSYKDNEYTLLTDADLLFVDPMATGFSKGTSLDDEKQFFSITDDAKSIAQFIELFLTRYKRWGSPLFLVGESYGTIRAVQTASILDTEHFIDIAGLVLISPALNIQMIFPDLGNDMPHINVLPTLAATAHFYKKLSPELQQKNLQELLAEVEEFALHNYATALLLSDKMEEKERKGIIQQIAAYTGLPEEYIRTQNMRLCTESVYPELLKGVQKTIGHYDTRYSRFYPLTGETTHEDPSLEAVASAFHTAFEQYLSQDLQWKKENPYIVINFQANNAWNWCDNRMRPGFGYFHCSDILEELLNKTPQLRTFFASGYYDMVTPYLSNDLTIDHLRLAPQVRSQIEQHYYNAGHMMYLHEQSLQTLHKDLKQYLLQTLDYGNDSKAS